LQHGDQFPVKIRPPRRTVAGIPSLYMGVKTDALEPPSRRSKATITVRTVNDKTAHVKRPYTFDSVAAASRPSKAAKRILCEPVLPRAEQDKRPRKRLRISKFPILQLAPLGRPTCASTVRPIAAAQIRSRNHADAVANDHVIDIGGPILAAPQYILCRRDVAQSHSGGRTSKTARHGPG